MSSSELSSKFYFVSSALSALLIPTHLFKRIIEDCLIVEACQSAKTRLFSQSLGEVAEWPNVTDSKSVVLKGTGGSNPSFSAITSASECD